MKPLLSTIAVVLLLQGCAGTELIVKTTEYDNWYVVNCASMNSRYRPGDPQCQGRGEPVTQFNQVHRVPKESEMTDSQRLIRDRLRHCGGPCQPLKY